MTLTFEEIIVFAGNMSPLICIVVVLFAYARFLEKK